MGNKKAFLDMLAFSEGTARLGSHDGYDIIVGSVPGRIIKLADFSQHPRVVVQVRGGLWSSAAGRYQFIWPTWKALQSQYDLPDFTPANQDKAALLLAREAGAEQMILAGEIQDAISACAHIWASLPGAGYGQRENELSVLLSEYQRAGGRLA